MTEAIPWQERRVIGDAVLYLGDALDIMPALAPVPVIVSDPPYGNSNHDADRNARLNAHRGIEGKPIANDDADGMRRVVDGTLKHAAHLLDRKASACCYFRCRWRGRATRIRMAGEPDGFGWSGLLPFRDLGQA